MLDRPFRTGDVITLGDERGAVLRNEQNNLVLVKLGDSDETWNADYCELAYRSTISDE